MDRISSCFGCLAPSRFGFPELQFVRVLGYGNEGVVWLVRHVDSEHTTSALKLIKRGFTSFYASAVADEVATLQRLSAGGGHVHVMGAQQLWLSPTHLAIEMAFAPGGTLTEHLDKHGTTRAGARALPEYEAVYFIRQARVTASCGARGRACACALSQP